MARTNSTPALRRRHLGLMLFGGVLLAIGIAVFWMAILPPLADVSRMSGWSEHRATLEQVGLKRSDDTARVTARYRYAIDGRPFVGTRVSIHGGSDNIGHFQRALYERLDAARAARQTVPVWVNPDDPGEAVLNRTLRLELLGLVAAFCVIPGVGGAYALAYGARRRHVTNADSLAERPWLARAEWSGGPIRSDARTGVVTLWCITAVLWLVVMPFSSATWTADELDSIAAMAVRGAAALACVGMTFVSLRAWLRWRRFGPTPLTLSPFPGVLGGPVAGRVALGEAVPTGTEVTVSLTAARVVGSGKNRRERVSGQWQQRVAVQPGIDGPVVDFALTAPADQEETDLDGARAKRWYLRVDAPGIKLSRRFCIPVYRDTGHHTGQARRVRSLDDAQARRAGGSRRSAIAAARDACADLLPIVPSTDDCTLELHYSLWRAKGHAATGFAVGLVFCAFAAFFWLKQGGVLFPVLFGGIGGLAVFCSFIALGRSFRLQLDDERLVIRRRWFGIASGTLDRPVGEIDRFTMKSDGTTSSGKGHTVHYRIVADVEGEPPTLVARGIDGEHDARQVVALFERVSGRDASAAEHEESEALSPRTERRAA